MTTVELGGITFHGTRHPSGLHFRRLIDWDGLPQSKSRPEPRPQAHGSFDGGEDFREGATPSIEGWYRGTDRADALRMRRRLAGALGGADLRMTVVDELGATHRDVSVRRVKPGDIVGDHFDFAIDTFAVDPKRYGPEIPQSTGLPVAGGGLTWPVVWPLTWLPGGSDGRVTASNEDGTVETHSMLEVTGGLGGGFSLVEVGTNREIRFERVIPLGSTVYANPRTGRVWIDHPDNDVSGSLTRDDWWTIPPGQESVIQFNSIGAVTGTPTFTARTSPAYW